MTQGLLFARLFDDAALFPPGNAPMPDAVPAHRALRQRLGALVGPFVVPSGRLDELIDALGAGPEFAVSVIAPAAELPEVIARIAAQPGLVLAGIEVPDVAAAAHAAAAARAATAHGVDIAVEVPRTERRDEVLDALASSGGRAKLRTGGLRRELFPSPDELAATIAACVDRGVAFKCTAGLHHAVRHIDPATGFVHHGFLNILAATAAIIRGERAQAAALLGGDDPTALTGEVRGWSGEQVTQTRSAFTSFGTCSVAEPVADLVALGLLPADPVSVPA
jgi:hypothetical protein